MILAGGKGERLRQAVSDRPKVLATVAGRPFLTHLFDQLSEAGIRRVVVCTGYRREEVERAMGDHYGPLELEYSREPVPLDTGGALRLALERLDTDPVLAMNGDSYCDLDFTALADWHRRKRAGATIALVHKSSVERFGSIGWYEDGRIAQFVEKACQGSGWINAGIYLLSRSVVEGIGAGEKKSLERDCFPAMAKQGVLFAYPGGKRFIDIGTPESYATADEFFRRQELSSEGEERGALI